MSARSRIAREERRQVLVADAATQRARWRAQVVVLRGPSGPARNRTWTTHALIAAGTVGACWLLAVRNPLAGAVRTLRIAQFALGCWQLAGFNRPRAPAPAFIRNSP